MRHLLIDTDTASDDVVALMMALQYPGVQVEAITVVAGNVPLDIATQNALYVVEQCKQKVPVYAGAAKPILRTLHTAQFVHGEDGMGDIGLPLQGREPAPGHAVDVIIDTIQKYPGEIELVALGPLTNLAIALLKAPAIAAQVKLCTIMGGTGTGPGNITAVSEYNIWADPEAAKIVLASGMRIRMAGWDIACNHATFGEEDMGKWGEIKHPLTELALAIQKGKLEFHERTLGYRAFELPDPIAVALALDERVATKSKKMLVDIVLADGPTRGQTIIDHVNVMEEGHRIEVVLEASREKFLDILFQTLQA